MESCSVSDNIWRLKAVRQQPEWVTLSTNDVCKQGSSQFKLKNSNGRNLSNLQFKSYKTEYKIYYNINLGNINTR